MDKLKKIVLIIIISLGAIGLYLFLRGLFYHPDYTIPQNTKGKHVVINEMKIRYYQEGSGKDIIFLHGGMGSVEDFEPLYGKLRNRYRLTSFDRPGYGYSEIKNSAYTLETNAQIIQKLIKELNLKNPVIFGHSHGGAVALNLAIKNPENIKGYILLAPAAYNYERFEKITGSLPMRLLRLPGINTGIALTVAPLIGDKMIEGTLRTMMADPRKFPNDFISFRQKLWNKPVSTITRAWQLAAYSEDIEKISNSYSSIHSPVLVLVGDKDSREVLDSAERLRQTIQNSKVRKLRNSGHYSQFDATDEVIREINSFISHL